MMCRYGLRGQREVSRYVVYFVKLELQSAVEGYHQELIKSSRFRATKMITIALFSIQDLF